MQQPDPLASLILPIIIITLLYWFISRSKKVMTVITGPTLVLKTFNIFTEENNGIYIEIIGRPAGIMSLVLTALRLETTSILTLMSDRLEYQGTSFHGEHHTVLPLPSIDSTSCGYKKPFGWVVLGVVAIIFGLIFNNPEVGDVKVVKSVFISLGVFFIIYYFFSKKMYITVTSGETMISLSFKKSAIDNVPVTLEKTLEAISVLNNVTVSSQMKP